jgi:hypothetical protein
MHDAMRNALPIAIAGGGIGGLATALALAQKGFRTLVCEQAPQFGQVGAGLQVAPNALSVLDALGVGGRAKSDALLIERMVMRDAVSGEEVSNIPCGEAFVARFGNPYAVAHRADIHGALLDACRAWPSRIELRTNCTVQGYAQQERAVLVEVTQARASATQVKVDASTISDPATFAKYQAAQSQLSGVLGRLMMISERYPDLKSNQNFLALQSQLEGTENRISVARNRYIKAVQDYNVLARSFPSNLTAMAFGYAVKPNLSVPNEAQISQPPAVDFGPSK